MDDTTFERVAALRLTPEQRGDLATPDIAAFLSDAPNHPTFTPYAVVARNEVVGLVSLGPVPASPSALWISLLAIDVDVQRRGYGRAALRAVVTLASELSNVRHIGLSFHAGNVPARDLYRSEGFSIAAEPDESGELEAWLQLPQRRGT